MNGIYQLPKKPTTGLICFWMFLRVFSFKVREWRNLLLSYDVMSIFLNIFFLNFLHQRIPVYGVQ